MHRGPLIPVGKRPMQGLAITHAPTTPASDLLLDLSEAAEVRDADGIRRFGSSYTIRRRVKDGSLPHTRVGAKYLVRLSDLEALEQTRDATDAAAAALAELEIAANRLLATRGPLTDEQCERIAARLRGLDR